MTSTELSQCIASLEHNIGQVVLGKPEVIRLAVVTLLAGEHLLLEDVPGVGKTLLAKSLARSVEGDFQRIQFTPDLLPTDIIGGNILDPRTQEFQFFAGPVFANIVLADEINRTTPRTQSALLEAMSEQQVSIDGVTRPLPDPFMVIATQNPFEFEGTYPLPESQLDRFLMRISLGYPNRANELLVLANHRSGEPWKLLQPAANRQQIVALRTAVRSVQVEPSLQNYLLDLVHATREADDLQVGVSTRGALCLYRAAQAWAFAAGRAYCIPDDIKHLAIPVLSHRVQLRQYSAQGLRAAQEQIMTRLVQNVTPPR
ncbi:MAG: AAA family ATPase [Pirellulales bacterium]|nr:AAA family ATPase [Pirellulales bacterium]